jgi:signal transduction histidine kinase/ActR/RegA family two-component response regulator
LVPVDTCYRILDVFLWIVAGVSTFALSMAYVRLPGLLQVNPLFWLLIAMLVPLVGAALLRGWPFDVRAGILLAYLAVFTICISLVLGSTPNWAFIITLLVCAASLFYGTRAGFATVVGMAVAHVLVAWGWVVGILPAFMPGPQSTFQYLDYTAPAVWVRLLVTAAGLQAALVLLMRFVLRNLNEALKDSNRALQQLAVEQEHRARAEEARLRAEVAVRETQKFDALGRMASGVAHDFNNILCVMKCWSSLLAEDTQEPQVREAMGEIRRATESAEQMTQHLLAFSRSDPAKREVIELAALLKLEAKTLSRLLPNVEVTANSERPVHVRLGRGQMQEIILNLAVNARDAMPRGGRFSLELAAEQHAGSNGLPAGRYARLDVTDTGEGMPPEVVARIFEPFYTTKQNGRGTGLGLAIVYGMVSGAGGRVTVESAPGRGTRFSLFLPEVDPSGPAQEVRAAAITAPIRCRVLVVETQPTIRALTERILSREGFPVMTAADGEAASQVLRVPGSLFGLVMVDLGVPSLTAAEIIRFAREANPECRIILATTQAPDRSVLGGIESGQYHLLAKPFDAGQLREAVNTVLSQRSK